MNDDASLIRKTTSDLLYDMTYAGAIGASTIALFFLAVDTIQGDPLHTPAMLGGVLFHGTPPDEATVRLDTVALYSLVHFAVFGAFGGVAAWVDHRFRLQSTSPFLLFVGLLMMLELGFIGSSLLFMPGVLAELNLGRVTIANALTAGAMTAFFVISQRSYAEDEPQRAKVSP